MEGVGDIPLAEEYWTFTWIRLPYFWRIRGRQDPNYMASGLVEVSVVSLTDLVLVSVASDEEYIRRGLRFF